jgi:hypothetical protein
LMGIDTQEGGGPMRSAASAAEHIPPNFISRLGNATEP